MGTTSRLSFCISGPSTLHKMNPDIMLLASCGYSLAHETYMHAFEQVAS